MKYQRSFEMKFKKYWIVTTISAVTALFLINKKKGGEDDMAMCYALLIIKDLRKFSEIPASQKEKTREYLIAFEAEELAVE